MPVISVSVISHRHGDMVRALIRDLESLRRNDLEIILTVNVPEGLDEGVAQRTPLTVIRNARPQGFTTNHNAAFRAAKGEYFCILNPDLRLIGDPFSPLLHELDDPSVGTAAPLVVDPAGRVEDSARQFPTVRSLFLKFLGLAPRLDYDLSRGPFSPDWAAGMFLLFRSRLFEQIGGFDERYFMYYDDVDICRRLRRAGYSVRLNPAAKVVHDARRASRRNPRHMYWHSRSMLRYLTTIYGD